jgi:periplasmic protein TonB
MNWREIPAAVPPAAFSAELSGWVEGVAQSLIRHTARHAPPSLSQRLEEEWLADMAARRGQMARLRLAIGCCWATRVIWHEQLPANLAAAASATGHETMTAYPRLDPSYASRRTVALLLIACLHTLLIYGLATGLVHRMIEVIPAPIQTTVIAETRTRPVPPPPAPPNLVPQRVELPEPVFPPDFPTGPDAVRDIVVEPPPHVTSPPPKSMTRVLGGPGPGFPNTDDYYPSASRRIGERGSATVRVCVDGSGRLTAGPTIAQSSGSARLDEGALKVAKAGSGHYRATTEDGRPVDYCYPLRIRFEFRD